MSLLRRCLAIAPTASGRGRTIVNLHAPITVTWLPAAAVPAARPTAIDRSPVGAFRRLGWIAAAAHASSPAAALDPASTPLAPAPTLRAFVRAAAPPQARVASVAARAERGSAARALPTALVLMRPLRAAAFADLTARLTHRGRREDLPVHPRTTALASSPMAVAAAAAAVRAAAAATPTVAPAPWVAPPAPPPAIDVTALTSQVMQQIDRRLIAYRERMGRV
jgi:hypothetical protein